jgi:hypothetical protein
MYPLKTILSFLMSGVTRIAPEDRAAALCSMLAGLLPQMSEEDIAAARTQVIAQFWSCPEVADEAADLIDGHLALRAILAAPADEKPRRRGRDPDYEV